MKVLKFGGTSVGTAENLLNVKRIVESVDDNVIVVVSALGGITDKLIETSRLAAAGDIAYEKSMTEIITRHWDIVSEVVPMGESREGLIDCLNALFEELHALYKQVFETETLSVVRQAAIVSFGERLSSNIVSCAIEDAVWYDSLSFIKTEMKHCKWVLDGEETNRLIHETFVELPKVALVSGFISTDKTTGEITNLGRGGSDYTAAILAAALDADCLEIWTDVNGFMTADPRVITSALPIQELSYNEAEELAKFGAKVIYLPTIYPVWYKQIPILIKNTMNPDASGTCIKHCIDECSNPIKGISFIRESCLLTIHGLDKNRISSLSHQLVQSLLDECVNLLVVPDNAGETSFSIGVKQEDVECASRLLTRILSECRIADFNIQCESDLSIIAVVGEYLEASLSDKLFSLMKEKEIHVMAVSQGNSMTHACMVENKQLLPALELIHGTLFYSHLVGTCC